MPSLETVTDIIQNQKLGNCVPVFIELPADLLTPCIAYLRLAKDSKYSFLLESVIAGENIARYSFIGAGRSSICCASTVTLQPLKIADVSLVHLVRVCNHRSFQGDKDGTGAGDRRRSDGSIAKGDATIQVC